jgi:transposase InsO family protein
MYDYGFKYTHMITKEAKERLRILEFWQKYGLKATKDAFGAKRSTLYGWRKVYLSSGRKIISLNLRSQAPKNKRKRIVDYRLVGEIRRLRLKVCPNLGKDKVKIFLDKFCKEHNLKPTSASTIGRIIKDKKIYHHRQKISHFGKVKPIKRTRKLRKPKEFKTNYPGDLVEVDTIVKFIWDIKRYVITAVDTKTRYTFAWSYPRPTSLNTRDFFQKLKTVFPYTIKHVQTDNGSEFHRFFQDYLTKQKTIHFWNYPRQPYKNGHVEKYNRTIQEEFIDWHQTALVNTNAFNQKLVNWLIWYNTQRPHWSLNLKSPVDYLITNNYLSRMRWTDTKS